jgi:hypothetical protein
MKPLAKHISEGFFKRRSALPIGQIGPVRSSPATAIGFADASCEGVSRCPFEQIEGELKQ